MYKNHTADIPGVGDRIDLEDPVEVDLWAKLLGVAPVELRQAAELVSRDYGDLVAYFADTRPGRRRQHFGLD